MSGITETELPALFEFVRNGLSVKQSKDPDGLPITRIETIWNGGVDCHRFGYAGLSKQDAEKWLLKRGDILFSHINSVEHIGKCALFDGGYDLVHGMNLLCFRPKLDRADPNYVKWLFRSEEFRSQIMPFVNKAVNQASISIGNLSSIRVRVPPLNEQKRIAAILDQADDLRRKRKQALERLNQLGQAIFYEMINSSDRQAWPETELSQFCDIQVGFAFKSNDYTDDTDAIRLCRGANVLPGRIDWSDMACLPESKAQGHLEFALCEGDIVIAMDRPWISDGFKLARIGKEDLPSLLVQRVARLRTLEAADSDLLFYLLKSPEFQSSCHTTETTVPHISPKDIRGYSFLCPPKPLRKEFSQRISTLRKMYLSSVLSESHLNHLFQSLQHRAFRGEL